MISSSSSSSSSSYSQRVRSPPMQKWPERPASLPPIPPAVSQVPPRPSRQRPLEQQSRKGNTITPNLSVTVEITYYTKRKTLNLFLNTFLCIHRYFSDAHKYICKYGAQLIFWDSHSCVLNYVTSHVTTEKLLRQFGNLLLSFFVSNCWFHSRSKTILENKF